MATVELQINFMFRSYLGNFLLQRDVTKSNLQISADVFSFFARYLLLYVPVLNDSQLYQGNIKNMRFAFYQVLNVPYTQE